MTRFEQKSKQLLDLSRIVYLASARETPDSCQLPIPFRIQKQRLAPFWSHSTVTTFESALTLILEHLTYCCWNLFDPMYWLYDCWPNTVCLNIIIWWLIFSQYCCYRCWCYILFTPCVFWSFVTCSAFGFYNDNICKCPYYSHSRASTNYDPSSNVAAYNKKLVVIVVFISCFLTCVFKKRRLWFIRH